MNFNDFRTYCNKETEQRLRKVGYTRRIEDIVADPNRVPLEEAKFFLMRAYNAIYYKIWNNETGNFDYKVTFTDKPLELAGEGFDKAQDALEHAINAIIDTIE